VPALFIAGTGTDVGKTYVAAALLREAAARGLAVDAVKPVVSGFDAAAAAGSDPAILLQALGRALTPDELDRVSPWRFRAPLAPNQAARLEGRCIDARAVVAFCRDRIDACGEMLLIIESAGGIMSPLDDDLTMLDLARILAVPVLLVGGSYLGAISHALTAVAVIRAAAAPLLGVVVNENERGPALADTVEAIARRTPGVAVASIARGGDAAAVADLVLAKR
jgi:dethiobiotin synthetase